MKKLIIMTLVAPSVFAAPVGVINQDVSQSTIKSTVCIKGWTSTIRPPVSYTNGIKRKLLPKGDSMKDYELDHVVPLALGGHPTDKHNLMLQPWEGKCGAKVKDGEEFSYYRAVCRGEISLDAARKHFMPWRCED